MPGAPIPAALHASLFPGVDFAGAGHGSAVTLTSAVVRDVARHAFRAGVGGRTDGGFAHLATLNRLRAAEACHSTTRTTFGDGVAVDVELATAFVPAAPTEAMAEAALFPFAYRVTLRNTGRQIVQVVGRHWVFEDAAGGATEVPRMSPGVVGHSPVLEPGQAFEYVSGTQLATPGGSMRGSFQVVVGPGTKLFDAAVAKTALVGPSDGPAAIAAREAARGGGGGGGGGALARDTR